MNWILSFIPAPYQLFAKVIGGIVLIIVLWAAWHAFTGHYIQEGKDSRNSEVASLNTQIGGLKVSNASFQSAAKQCNDQVTQLQADSARMKAAGAAAKAEADKNAQGMQEQAAWWAAQLNKPDAKNKGCADALKEWRAQP